MLLSEINNTDRIELSLRHVCLSVGQETLCLGRATITLCIKIGAR